MTTPPTFVIYRSAIAGVTVLLLLLFALGLGGIGPMDGLHALTSHAVSWFRAQTGMTTP
jgi:hypothetical protein